MKKPDVEGKAKGKRTDINGKRKVKKHDVAVKGKIMNKPDAHIDCDT